MNGTSLLTKTWTATVWTATTSDPGYTSTTPVYRLTRLTKKPTRMSRNGAVVDDPKGEVRLQFVGKYVRFHEEAKEEI